MTNADKPNDPNLWIIISVRNGNIGITGITMISRKKSRNKNIAATIGIIKDGIVTTTTIRVINVVDLTGLEHRGNITSIGINDHTTKVRMMTGTRSRVKTNHMHLEISDV